MRLGGRQNQGQLYYALPAVRHAAPCNAHNLRELKALIDIDKEQWAGQMRDLLVESNGAMRRRVEGAATLPTPVLRTLIKRYNAIIRRGLAFHRNLPPSPDGAERADGRPIARDTIF